MNQKVSYYQNQGLFSTHYLEYRLPENEYLWENRDLSLRESLSLCQDTLLKVKQMNLGVGEEASLEEYLIRPILKQLGFGYEVQPITQRGSRKKHPDYALFDSQMSLIQARKKKSPDHFYSHAVAIVEVKHWGRRLNDKDTKDVLDSRDPTAQLIKYLEDVHFHSNQKIDWGILTNGKKWRLYYYKAQSKSQSYYEIDLEEIVASENLEAFKYFYLFFSRQAFVTDPTFGKCWLDVYVEGSESYSQAIQEQIKNLIFDEIFEELARGFIWYRQTEMGILSESAETLAAIFDGCLILLYRLLFILYAESRNLLPVQEETYLRKSVYTLRDDILRDLKIFEEKGITYQSYDYWARFSTLCRIISKGDKFLNVPIYNGGLFKDSKNSFLIEHMIPDPLFSKAIRLLTIDIRDIEKEQTIDYSSLGVRQLGDIYEGLLEFHLRIAREPMVCIKDKGRLVWIPESMRGDHSALEKREVGEIYIENSNRERKLSGSYFTPHFIVEYIVKHTVGAVFDDRIHKTTPLIAAYEKECKKEKKDPYTLQKLGTEIFESLFSVTVLDPAMGSGHFLVHTVDYLSNRIIAFLAENPDSPVVDKIEKLRSEILKGVQEQGVIIDESKLTEVNLIKRMVMKRCIYGVDLNPMAVELAKLSLWLDSFTLGAPLSFLDHHLKCGNSLIGAEVQVVRDLLASSLFGSQFQGLLSATTMFNELASIPDSTFAEVEQSRQLFESAEKHLAPFKLILDIYISKYFVNHDKKFDSEAFLSMNGDMEVLIKNLDELKGYDKKVVDTTRSIQRDLRFFHWELEFPEIFYEKGRERYTPGFECIIGNPPWERVKLQEKEYFAVHDLNIVHAGTASKRKKLIDMLKSTDPELWHLYNKAKDKAVFISNYFRTCDKFPLLGRGDVNYFSIMVEQSTRLIMKGGKIGMVIPSGIATDKTSEYFFQTMITQKRLIHLMDFENRKGYFNNVHKSFKYSIVILGGINVISNTIQTAFFLHEPEDMDINDRIIQLTPDDFSIVNPNTKTCPIFLCEKDAIITIDIYKKIPILIRKKESKVISNEWNIKFSTLFHMANESHHFKTLDEMEADGFWLAEDNSFNKGAFKYLPLYEGKMIQLYDYRAANILIERSNLHRPAYQVPLSLEEHKSIQNTPLPQFWVPKEAVINKLPDKRLKWLIGFKDICSPTNKRTMIISVFPLSGATHKLPLIQPLNVSSKLRICFLANFSSFILDFIARKKVGGQNLTYFIVEQLPVLPPSTYEKPFNGNNLIEFITKRVLELVYTATTMKAFAEDLGYSGDPFTWDTERRIHLQSQLDALFFLLYGITYEDVGYVMESFPIVKKQDIAAYGTYRTRKLIETYFRAYKAGDWDAWVKG